ncbi:MAG TPA: serine hydrolase [Kofleriaceae bacterium]|nr:serine hydrolase [Kofleriaceae bacterium]
MHLRRFVTVGIAFGLAWGGIGRAEADKPPENGGLPSIRSRSAVVLDARTGAEVYGKDADSVRAIASTTKIFVAMAVRKKGMDLDGWTEILREDAKAAAGGSRTRLDIGQTFRNADLLRAMLMASDNRAPTALGRAAGMDPKELIAAMNGVAKDLGLKKTRFTDTSGLRGNVSTAREMALALRAALTDPVLAEIMGTTTAEIRSKSNYARIRYNTTNVPMILGQYKVAGGKTGYTHAAGYCFVTGAQVKSRDYLFVFLGADGKDTRFADFNRAARWLDEGAPGAKVAPKVVPAKGTRTAIADEPVRVKASGTAKR